MPAWPSGHVGWALYRALQGRTRDGRGGSHSGRGRRGLWSHHEANSGRLSVRQVPIHGSDAVEVCHAPPTWEVGVPKTFRDEKGPHIVQSLGTTKKPSGSPKPLQP